MGNEVFANGNEIACKSGDGKVIAAFPDVCLSPPSPPAGPVPVPYPDTSFSKDMKSGSKKVKIDGKEVMLKDKSFYKTSPLGNEAATRSFGANVMTHMITGKTYFVAWSMDIKIEGLNIDRHLDLTISNCGSYPGGTGPFTELEKLAIKRIKKGKCPCCGKNEHMSGTPMNMEEWYVHNNPGKKDKVKELLKKCSIKERRKAGCSCYRTKRPRRLLPEPPCNVFFQAPDGDTYEKAYTAIKEKYDNAAPLLRKQLRVSPRSDIMGPHLKAPRSIKQGERWKKTQQLNHLTPKSAGGCPDNIGNLEAHVKLCKVCQGIDDEFTAFQEQR